MPSRHRFATFALALAATALLAACGKGDGSTTSSGAAPAATTAAAHPTAAATATAAAPTATAAPAKGGACSFTGVWIGTYPPGPYPFSGTQFEFDLNADGTGMTKSQRADSEIAWKTEGNVFDIHGVKVERGGRFSCSKDDVGKWGYTFTPDCSTVTFKVVSDPCKGRAKTADGTSMKRK